MYLWMILTAGLAMVAWQDFRYRAVYTWLFPVLCMLFIVHALQQGVFSTWALAANLLVIALQLAVLNLLMYWRTKKWLMRDERWIGWGDLAFFVVLACSFSTVNFVIFYVVSLVIILAVVLMSLAFGRFVRQIPLAGGQAVLLAALWVADYTNAGRSLYEDINWVRYVS